jgi:hypothetical protein
MKIRTSTMTTTIVFALHSEHAATLFINHVSFPLRTTRTKNVKGGCPKPRCFRDLLLFYRSTQLQYILFVLLEPIYSCIFSCLESIADYETAQCVLDHSHRYHRYHDLIESRCLLKMATSKESGWRTVSLQVRTTVIRKGWGLMTWSEK